MTTLFRVLSLLLLISLSKSAASECEFGPPANYVRIGGEQNDPPKNFTNSIGTKFVWIKPGSFLMGSPREDLDRRDDEIQHGVTLTKGFYMSIYTVTLEEWQEVMRNNSRRISSEKNMSVDVSWNDCQDFIQKLREKDKKAYRLPSEAEWEYCCRAGTKTRFYFGDDISTAQSNFNGTLFGGTGIFREKLTPVGSFPANAWGLYDMHGNVFQWCQDWYGEYPQKVLVDPQGPKEGKFRVLRGGSWKSGYWDCRSAYRSWQDPRWTDEQFGFRVCFFLEK
jgi:formylglycine-generating enzyme